MCLDLLTFKIILLFLTFFIFYIHHLDQAFADTSYMYKRCSCDKGQVIWKSSFFSKRATLTIILKKEILNERSLKLV